MICVSVKLLVFSTDLSLSLLCHHLCPKMTPRLPKQRPLVPPPPRQGPGTAWSWNEPCWQWWVCHNRWEKLRVMIAGFTSLPWDDLMLLITVTICSRVRRAVNFSSVKKSISRYNLMNTKLWMMPLTGYHILCANKRQIDVNILNLLSST